MRAAVYKGNKKFIIEERSEKEPSNDEVRLKIAFCGICGTDVHVYHGIMDKSDPLSTCTTH